MQYTVRSLAKELGLERVIDRGFSFYETVSESKHVNFPHTGLWGISVYQNDRLQRVAGKCRYVPMELELHPALFGPFAQRNELIETFLHELAHAMAWVKYGSAGRGHGEHWWEMMHQLGQIPRRCHNIAACTKADTKAVLGLDDMGL